MKQNQIFGALSLLTAISFPACGVVDEPTQPSDESTQPSDESTPEEAGTAQGAVKNASYHVFVIAMENHDSAQIYGNGKAPYINSLRTSYAWASNFVDTLPALWSEPHYVAMEAGKNNFADHTFLTDNDASSGNSTGSTAHLVTQLKNNGLSWMSYQEGMTAGTCPIASVGNYAAKHDPFVFFKDVSGSPPSKTNQYCIDHHRPYSQLASNLTSATPMANYVFITPNLCHDMHDGCVSDAITDGDNWLKTAVPPIIDYLKTHSGVLFIVWDEGEASPRLPFIAVGPTVKQGYKSTALYSHASLVKSTERIFGLPVLSAATNSNDFRDLFTNDPLGVGGIGDECPSDSKKLQPGICGCGKTERYDAAGYTDAQGYACKDWLDYDCKQAAEQDGYTAAQEADLLAHCSLSCGVCP